MAIVAPRSMLPNPFKIWIGLWVLTMGCSEHSGTDSNSTGQTPSSAAIEIGEPYVIEITGHKYRWHIRYPGADGIPSTSDDVTALRNLHLPQEKNIVLVLKSNDFVYKFALPDFNVNEMAVPSLEFRASLHPTVTGTFELIGDEFCGDPHPELNGAVFVEPPDQFRKWLSEQPLQASTDATH